MTPAAADALLADTARSRPATSLWLASPLIGCVAQMIPLSSASPLADSVSIPPGMLPPGECTSSALMSTGVELNRPPVNWKARSQSASPHT